MKVKESQFKQISDEQSLKVQEFEEKLSTRIQMYQTLRLVAFHLSFICFFLKDFVTEQRLGTKRFGNKPA